MKSTAEVVKVKEAYAWIDNQSSIALQATTRDGKPLKLTPDEVRLLATRLIKLADVLESIVEQERERTEGEGESEGEAAEPTPAASAASEADPES
ncbi:MAG: hypothetical protein K0V04_33790 [Deltaproteobacteria bacterium]|nr:hypothetical protein [Deltaproteobacteria bacterium]